MANPEEIGPAYQCTTCLAWGRDYPVCATCEAAKAASTPCTVTYSSPSTGEPVGPVPANVLFIVDEAREIDPELWNQIPAQIHSVSEPDWCREPITVERLRESIAKLGAAYIVDASFLGKPPSKGPDGHK